MAKIVIVGAGFAGHTAAMYLGDAIGKDHEITVVNRFPFFSYIPSWVWVAVGHMKPEKTHFPLKPVYDRLNVNLKIGRVTEVHPDEKYILAAPAEGTEPFRLDYDYLVIATGPKLNFAGTPGLGPDEGFTDSICTLDHTTRTAAAYGEVIERLKRGEKQEIVIGTGHPGATCQGAAFEYLSNVHKDLVKKKLRDKVRLVWLSNERAVGDFGVRGVAMRRDGVVHSSEAFVKEIFEEYGIESEVRKGVHRVEKGKIFYQDYEGEDGELRFDFSVLIPQFTGVPIRYLDKDGNDLAGELLNPAGFVKVDGIYGLPFETLRNNPDAWPGYYQNPVYKNIFAAGIAFAPPGPISVPHTNPKGMSISAAPPRTGMVSGIIGRVVAKNIIDLIRKGRMTHHERMSEMVAACIASMGDSLWDGAAATMVIYPVVPDERRYPNEQGRDQFVTHLEMGLAGAWMKRMLHTTFIYKFRGFPGWKIIPE